MSARPEPAVVPWLLPFAFGEQGERASAALRALSACVAIATPLDLLDLDEECRRRWWYADDPGPRAEVAIDGAILADPSGDPTRAIGVLSFHPNGRVRERAVEQLSTITRAETAVQRRMVPSNAEAFVVQLPIVLRLETRRRRQHGMLIDACSRCCSNRRASARCNVGWRVRIVGCDGCSFGRYSPRARAMLR